MFFLCFYKDKNLKHNLWRHRKKKTGTRTEKAEMSILRVFWKGSQRAGLVITKVSGNHCLLLHHNTPSDCVIPSPSHTLTKVLLSSTVLVQTAVEHRLLRSWNLLYSRKWKKKKGCLCRVISCDHFPLVLKNSSCDYTLTTYTYSSVFYTTGRKTALVIRAERK